MMTIILGFVIPAIFTLSAILVSLFFRKDEVVLQGIVMLHRIFLMVWAIIFAIYMFLPHLFHKLFVILTL